MEEAEGVREKVRFGVEGDEVVEAGAIGGRGLDGVRVGAGAGGGREVSAGEDHQVGICCPADSSFYSRYGHLWDSIGTLALGGAG